MNVQQEDAGYYCLLIAIFCDLDSNGARIMFEYGPKHPFCKKYKKKKVGEVVKKQMEKLPKSEAMKRLQEKGYSIEAISDVFNCCPSTVRRRIKKLNEESIKIGRKENAFT